MPNIDSPNFQHLRGVTALPTERGNLVLGMDESSVYVPLPIEGGRVLVDAAITPETPRELEDDGTPLASTGAGSFADGVYRSIALVVTQGPVLVNGVSVQTGFSIYRAGDAGQTVPGFSWDATGGEVVVDSLRELP